MHWGQFIRGNEQMEFFQYPRTLATAEVGWSPQSARNYANFVSRVAALGGRLALDGVNHFPTAEVPWRVDGTAAVTKRDGEVWTLTATVTAPATEPGQIRAHLRMPNGSTVAVPLTTNQTTDIAAMRINGIWRGSATITTTNFVPRHGTVLVIEREGRSAVEVPVTLVG